MLSWSLGREKKNLCQASLTATLLFVSRCPKQTDILLTAVTLLRHQNVKVGVRTESEAFTIAGGATEASSFFSMQVFPATHFVCSGYVLFNATGKRTY